MRLIITIPDRFIDKFDIAITIRKLCDLIGSRRDIKCEVEERFKFVKIDNSYQIIEQPREKKQ